jgi:hypothetical protein
LAANRPDRNLRFVLGHAFTLDKLMLRIVEIENQSSKDAFEGAGDDAMDTHYDCTAAKPVPPDTEFDCTKPAEPAPERGRRISFQDNNARPSSTAGVGSNNGGGGGAAISPAGRKRSPPPVAMPAAHLADDSEPSESESSDDYEDPDSFLFDGQAQRPSSRQQRPVHDAYSDEEDAALELADDELTEDPEEEGLGLTRFESASARPPRMVRSASSSSDEADEAVSPPQLPADLDVQALLEGDVDDELAELYESVRHCSCHGQRETVGGAPQGVWDVPLEKTGGKRLAIMAVAV